MKKVIAILVLVGFGVVADAGITGVVELDTFNAAVADGQVTIPISGYDPEIHSDLIMVCDRDKALTFGRDDNGYTVTWPNGETRGVYWRTGIQSMKRMVVDVDDDGISYYYVETIPGVSIQIHYGRPEADRIMVGKEYFFFAKEMTRNPRLRHAWFSELQRQEKKNLDEEITPYYLLGELVALYEDDLPPSLAELIAEDLELPYELDDCIPRGELLEHISRSTE